MLSMFRTVITNLLSRPATIPFPAKPLEHAPLVRGRVDVAIENCVFCGLCQRRCPTKAITVERPEKAWTIRRLDCILCGECVAACPKKCLHINNRLSQPVGQKYEDRVQDARVPDNPGDS